MISVYLLLDLLMRLVNYIGHGAILILARVARFGKPHDEDNLAHEGDQCEKHPPSRFIDVVKATQAKSKSGKEEREKQCR